MYAGVVSGAATMPFLSAKPSRLSAALSPSVELGLANKMREKGKNCSNSVSVKASFGSSKGGAGVLERPTFDQSQYDPSTQVLQGGDVGGLRDKKRVGSGDSYKVLLIDDARHTESLVAKALPQAVPSVTPDDAIKLFHVSREIGVAVVLVTVKEHAEFYSQMMTRMGLRSTIEPESGAA